MRGKPMRFLPPTQMRQAVAAMALAALACLTAPAVTLAQNAYITNAGSRNVSVIDTVTNTVVGSPIAAGFIPFGVAVTPDGSKVYVTNSGGNDLLVIATATNTVIANFAVGRLPAGVAVTPDGSKVYVASHSPPTVSVIDTATDTVAASIPVGVSPQGVAVTPDGSKVYVTDTDGSVAVIATDRKSVV